MCLLTALAYAGSLSGWFVYEDPYLTSAGSLTWDGWSTHVTRSLSHASHVLTMTLFGAGPFPARVVNLLWHMLNGTLVWRLARCVGSDAAAVFVAGLFLLHPLQTETVAYLASRPELVTATWVLLACGASVRGRIWIAALCAALAMTGKEVGVVAWLLVPCWAWLTRQSWTARSREWWIASTGVVLAAFAVAVATYPRPLTEVSWGGTGAQLVAVARLLWLVPEALWRPDVLTIDHDWSWITQEGRPLAALLIAPLVFACAWRSRWSRFACAWLGLALLPRLVLPFPDGIHERHLYVPLLGAVLALAGALSPEGGSDV